MLRAKYSMAGLLVLLCLSLVLVPEALAAPAEGNITRYIPQDQPDQRAHTIYWAAGITPPTMPGQLLPGGGTVSPEAADFVLINGDGKITEPQENFNPKEYTEFYVTEYLPGNGWYDLNKQYQKSGKTDFDMCFGMSASNLIHWWIDRNRDNINRYLKERPEEAERLNTFLVEPETVLQDPNTSPVYKFMLDAYGLTGEGGFPDQAMDYFFNGYPTKNHDGRNLPTHYKGGGEGGFFYPVFGRSIITSRPDDAKFWRMERDLKQLLTDGYGIGVQHSYMGPGKAHAITLWGAEYDPDGKLCAVFLTDNNDSGKNSDATDMFTDRDGQSKLKSMYRSQIFEGQDGKTQISLLKEPNGSGSQMSNLYLLAPVQEGWDYFFAHNTPRYPNGQAFCSPMDCRGNQGCEHQLEYIAEGSRLRQVCHRDDCTHIQSVSLAISYGRSLTYTGKAITPGIVPSYPADWVGTRGTTGYENNVHAGQAYYTLTVNGVTARFPFTIAPQPMPATDEVPELKSAPTPYSVALVPIPGHEFSCDGETWSEEGLFEGLEPGQSYTFSVRRAAPDTDHAPALSPNTLSVTLPAGESLAEPVWSIGQVSFDAGTAEAVLSNPGRWDAVTLLAAGYDSRGRMTAVTTRELWKGGSDAIVVGDLPMPADTEEVRVFLLRENAPACGAKSSLDR